MADAVDTTIREIFPKKYAGLCHIYAVVGAALLSISEDKPYRPVAGVALINAGGGQCIELLDELAFLKPEGGAYHCWIESVGGAPEIVDFTFRNNKEYAELHGIKWRAKKQAYLWEAKHDIMWDRNISIPSRLMPKGKVWFNETELGKEWMNRQMQQGAEEYAKILSIVLRRLRTDCDDYRFRSCEFRNRSKIFALMYLYPVVTDVVDLLEVISLT